MRSPRGRPTLPFPAFRMPHSSPRTFGGRPRLRVTPAPFMPNPYVAPRSPSPATAASCLFGVHRPPPAAVLHRHDPRLLSVHAPGVGLGRPQAHERQRCHAPVGLDAPARPPRRAGPLVLAVGRAQLDLVVRRGLGDVPHAAFLSTGTRPPSSLTATIRSGPGARRV